MPLGASLAAATRNAEVVSVLAARERIKAKAGTRPLITEDALWGKEAAAQPLPRPPAAAPPQRKAQSAAQALPVLVPRSDASKLRAGAAK